MQYPANITAQKILKLLHDYELEIERNLEIKIPDDYLRETTKKLSRITNPLMQRDQIKYIVNNFLYECTYYVMSVILHSQIQKKADQIANQVVKLLKNSIKHDPILKNKKIKQSAANKTTKSSKSNTKQETEKMIKEIQYAEYKKIRELLDEQSALVKRQVDVIMNRLLILPLHNVTQLITTVIDGAEVNVDYSELLNHLQRFKLQKQYQSVTTMLDSVIGYFRDNDKRYWYTGFDQKIFVLNNFSDDVPYMPYYKLEKMFENSIKPEDAKYFADIDFLTNTQQILLDNITYLQITPTQMLMPVPSKFKNKHQQYLLTPKIIEGKIGLNAVPADFLKTLVNLQIGELIKPKTVKIPSLIVALRNPNLSLKASVIILSDVVIYGLESDLKQEALPQQYIYEFYASNIWIRDYGIGTTVPAHDLLNKLFIQQQTTWTNLVNKNQEF